MEELLFRDRRGTDSVKWNRLTPRFSREGLLGLWVADMDFAAPACVRETLARMADFGVFGYDAVPDAFFQAFLDWERTRHGYAAERKWLRICPGVVAALNWLVQSLTQPGDGVVVQTPVYYPFLSAVTDNGRRLVENPLVNQNGVYTMDLPGLERTLRQEQVSLMILCSPHNPVGRVWTQEELRQVLALCSAAGVVVISDEIHQDFTFGGAVHVPAAAAGTDARVITLTSPSKTFNLAGLKTALAILPDPDLRAAYDRHVRPLHADGPVSLGIAAAQAAYTGGGPWLEAVRCQVWENHGILRRELAERCPGVTLSPLEGTYLAWLDLGIPPEALVALVEDRCGLAVDYGSWFGSGGTGHIRLNLATRPELIRQAASALREAL